MRGRRPCPWTRCLREGRLSLRYLGRSGSSNRAGIDLEAIVWRSPRRVRRPLRGYGLRSSSTQRRRFSTHERWPVPRRRHQILRTIWPAGSQPPSSVRARQKSGRIGVVAGQMSVVVDDPVDSSDRNGGVCQLVDHGDNRLFVRQCDAAGEETVGAERIDFGGEVVRMRRPCFGIPRRCRGVAARRFGKRAIACALTDSR